MKTIFALIMTIGIFAVLLLSFIGAVIWYFKWPKMPFKDYFFDDIYAVLNNYHRGKWYFINTGKRQECVNKYNADIVIYKNWFAWAWTDGKRMTWFEYDFEQRKKPSHIIHYKS